MPAFLVLALILFLVILPVSRSSGREKPPRMLSQTEFDEVMALVNRNRKVEAIAVYRRLTGATLKQATDWLKTVS